ncbi:hypothetical protein D9615_000727 [Tricholomella constricta]|uniref:Uncharacterized protein n=1 Tax=Tricholomella constricta TaxID=117010 RepID=A0A8H5HRN1_9AGAR|nr:hypothetical protein D9615_000727 [Tricholomella constricta]
MAPKLRSSAPNTPNGKSTGENEPSSVTPRKAPVCTKCKRPRAGHPRSGCPYVDSPSKESTARTPPPAAVEGNTIEDAMGSMQLASPAREREEDTRTAIRNRRRSSQATAAALAPAKTLLSLDSESQEIVERLLQSGMFDDDAEDDANGTSKIAARVVRWQETLVNTPAKLKRKKIKMPGSLSTPSPDSSQGSVPADKAATSPSAPAASAVAENDAAPSPPSLTRRPQPLARSMSVEERDVFLSSLNNSSDATVYVVPRDDIHNIHADAIKLGFHARIVLGKDTSDPQGLLVLAHNEAAVKRLYAQVESEREKSSRFRAAASGAVVGAVGAFAGLAFS